jgi:hypothetical protein
MQFSLALREFLDSFYLEADPAARLRMLEAEPRLLGDRRDAYLGAACEHLVRRWRLAPAYPAWAESPERFLDAPWFATSLEAMRPYLLAESPLAFRRRLIFTEAEPLRRARMPRDTRWIALERIRAGCDAEAGTAPAA